MEEVGFGVIRAPENWLINYFDSYIDQLIIDDNSKFVLNTPGDPVLDLPVLSSTIGESSAISESGTIGFVVPASLGGGSANLLSLLN